MDECRSLLMAKGELWRIIRIFHQHIGIILPCFQKDLIWCNFELILTAFKLPNVYVGGLEMEKARSRVQEA